MSASGSNTKSSQRSAGEGLESSMRACGGRMPRLCSPCKIYSLLGITGAAKRRAMRSTTEASESASRWIWIKRSEKRSNAAGRQVRPGHPRLGCLREGV